MPENENPDPICPDLVEYAEDAYIWFTSYLFSQENNARLIQQVEELQSHAQAVQDGLDQEMFA